MYEQLLVISLNISPSAEYVNFVDKVVLKSQAEQEATIDKSIVSEF